MRTRTLWTALVLSLVMLGGVFAYDASTPYTVVMKWIIPSDTSFLVVLAGAETTIDFNPATKTQTLVEPDSQSAAGSVPIVNLYNAGNVEMDFKNYLNASKPAWAVVMVNNDNDPAGATAFDTTAVAIESNVAIGSNVTVYLWTNVSNAIAGTTTRLYGINTTDST